MRRCTWLAPVAATLIAVLVSPLQAQFNCPNGGRADAVDFFYNTATWHDWNSGQDYFQDPMGWCQADGQTGGWGYTDHDYDWLYYGDAWDDHQPHDYELSDIPSGSMHCPDGTQHMMFVRTSDNWVANEWCELIPQPPHRLLPTEIDAWYSVVGMWFDWILGMGPDTTSYRQGTLQTYQLQTGPSMWAARNYWYQKNAYHISNENCQNLEPVYSFDVRFGLEGARDAGNNATEQFVGSYRVDIVPNNDGTAVFTVWNITSMQSFLYDMGPSWSRENFPPGGNQAQIYTWTERMCGQAQ